MKQSSQVQLYDLNNCVFELRNVCGMDVKKFRILQM
jgi:hypothetical protein